MRPVEVELVRVDAVRRTYGGRGREVTALAGASLTVAEAEVVAVMGPSGCGKSTLLQVIGGLDAPDSGTVTVAGRDWAALGRSAAAAVRRRTVGYIFQTLDLLPMATAAENVEVPLLLDRMDRAQRAERVADVLATVGLAEQAHHLPDQLSGGQQQRVAIARALVHRPALVLADEPTGSLDSQTAQAVTRLLVDAARQRRAGVILVTHDPQIAGHADRVVRMHSGVVEAGPVAVAEVAR